MSVPMQINPEEMRAVAQAIHYLGDDARAIQNRLNAQWRRLDAGWESYTRADVNGRFHHTMREMTAMTEMLSQIGVALKQTADTLDTADTRASAFFAAVLAKTAVAGGLGPIGNSLRGPRDGKQFPDNPLWGLEEHLINRKDGEPFPSMPLYHLEMDDPYSPDTLEFIKNLDTGGRPVVFIAHGWTVGDEAAQSAYLEMVKKYEAQYAGLPESQQPVFVGIDWNANEHKSNLSDEFGSYVGANLSAERTGERFGQLLDLYNQEHPDSSINIIAHSLGNKMAMEGIANSDVQVNSYLAIQAAVGTEDISSNGKYSALLDQNRVNHLGITHAENDPAMYLHDAAAALDLEDAFTGDNALGNSPNEIGSIKSGRSGPTEIYNLTFDGEIADHYSLDNQVVFDETAVDFFGENGEGFRDIPSNSGSSGAW